MGSLLDDKNLILLGMGAAGLIYLYPKIKAALNPTSAGKTSEIFQNLGATATTTAKDSPYGEASFVTYGNTTYKFLPGDWDRLNWAQKFLLTTHIGPASWVLG